MASKYATSCDSCGQTVPSYIDGLCPACYGDLHHQTPLRDIREPLVYDPPHYHLPGSDVQCIDVVERLGLGMHVGSAFQYLWRAGRKEGGDELLDLKKARWYIDRRIAQLEYEKEHPTYDFRNMYLPL